MDDPYRAYQTSLLNRKSRQASYKDRTLWVDHNDRTVGTFRILFHHTRILGERMEEQMGRWSLFHKR